MKKHIITSSLAVLASCSLTFGQFGGFDFGGGGGAGSGSLSGYTSKTNIDYVGDNHVGHKLDIYYPNDGKATHNVIIHIYGSAWGSNDSKGSADHGTVGKAALEAGYIFVTPNHRTYNDALWPAQINDIKAVVRYLRGNKEELKIDDSFIGISGFSSGGHLASMMGVTNGETVVKVGGESIDIEGKLGKYTSESSRVDAVCDWSGPVDCRDKTCGNPINMSPENDMVGGCGPQQCPDKHATLGTNTYIDANDVPHMICHGTTDNIVPSCEGEKYANNLKKAGIYVEWYNPGHGHQVNGDYTDEMIKFFNKIRSEKGEQGGSQQGGGEEQGGGQQQGGGEEQGGTQQGGGEQGGSSNCVDPCSYKTKYSGGKSISSNGVQDVGNGYNLEMWRDGNSGGMTVFGGKADCAFKANWNNSGDYLARVGYYDGSAKKKYTDLGEIYAVYNYTKSGNGGGSYSYIGIYGWTKNPLIEYYIVDDSFTPNGGGMFWGANNKGTYTVDGVTYTLKVGQRNNAPSIEGDGKNFQQIFAVRSSYQTCGTINVTEHFKNWEKLGVKLGGIYDCKILCEVGGGSGSIEYTCASMSWKGQSSSLGDLSCSEGGSQGGGEQGGGSEIVEQKPYKDAIKIPGTLEGEHYDIGGNGNAYKDSDDENEGDAKFRTDEGVDIVKGGTGMAVGYTTSSEWLEYTVDVEKTGVYDLTANASNGGGEINFDLYIDDAKVATVTGDKTSSWDTYTALKATTKEIKAGKHILKVKFGSNNNNLDYIKFAEHSEQGGGEQGGSHGGGSHSGNCVDPCSYTTKYSGGSSVSSNGVKDIGNGYNLEMWRDGNSGGMTVFGGKADCAFKANWNNSGDYLARVGYYDGSAKKKYTDLGEIYAVYNYTKSGNGGGNYSYIGIYGWTKNPLIEYYIVDDSFTPNGGGMFWGANNKGTYTVDGVTYTLKVGQRNNAPSIEGDGKNFQQIFAVRSSYQTCGTINVTEHFKNWEKLGVKLGGIYDCKILCEVGGGSGSIEYTCASMSWKGQSSSLGDLSCKEGETEVSNTYSETQEFTIVPNPASTEIYIISDGEIENVVLFNAVGDIVARSNESRVDVSALPTGVYFVKATIEGETAVKKLVVTK